MAIKYVWKNTELSSKPENSRLVTADDQQLDSLSLTESTAVHTCSTCFNSVHNHLNRDRGGSSDLVTVETSKLSQNVLCFLRRDENMELLHVDMSSSLRNSDT